MSTRNKLLISVSTVALIVGASAVARADQNYTATHTAAATAGGNTSSQTTKSNLNQNIGNAFIDAKGVVSEVQNNGDNAALNNGNTVSASIGTGTNTGILNYDSVSRQTATQAGGSTVTESGVNDDNIAAGNVFREAQGVFSKLQNNGAESAINNGNSVAAAIVEGASSNTILDTESRQIASVNGGSNTYNANSGSTNDNDIRDNAFESTQGVVSAAQNNGPNSAGNNGNSVSAVISPDATVGGDRTYDADSRQSATVIGANSSGENTNTDNNQIRDQAFENAQGVVSAAQNNGANTAFNNGNTVSAVISDNAATNGNSNFDTNQVLAANQQAQVEANSDGNITANQVNSNDANSITDNAFENIQGVVSALQNNGPNSSLNNGNTVSAVITNGGVSNGTSTFDTHVTQTAAVSSRMSSTTSNTENDSADTNTISLDAFQDAQGIVSALQNNGANSAVNNGNAVSAVIADLNITNERAVFRTDSRQTSTVEARGGSGLNSSSEHTDNSNNTNTITNDAFRFAEGVISAAQNNGANSALNNGNTVSAFVTNSLTNTASNDTLSTDSLQRASVLVGVAGGTNRSTQNNNTDDSNNLSLQAFDGAQGIMSALQNNGANSAGNNGNTVSAIIADGNIDNSGTPFSAESRQVAMVDAGGAVGNRSNSLADSDNTNTVRDTTFQDAVGVMSALQNNGANSALNNGNTVSAFTTDASVDMDDATPNFSATSVQTASVGASDDGTNVSSESGNSDDVNQAIDRAFQNAQGVGSLMQNNGANSALNGGNTVAAIINSCGSCDGTLTFTTTSAQTSTVVAGTSSATHTSSSNTNTVSGSAFSNVAGVFSVTQNNAPNSAISNGNTVSAVIVNN